MGTFSHDEWPNLDALCWGDQLLRGSREQVEKILDQLAREEAGNSEAIRILAIVRGRIMPIFNR